MAVHDTLRREKLQARTKGAVGVSLGWCCTTVGLLLAWSSSPAIRSLLGVLEQPVEVMLL